MPKTYFYLLSNFELLLMFRGFPTSCLIRHVARLAELLREFSSCNHLWNLQSKMVGEISLVRFSSGNVAQRARETFFATNSASAESEFHESFRSAGVLLWDIFTFFFHMYCLRKISRIAGAKHKSAVKAGLLELQSLWPPTEVASARHWKQPENSRKTCRVGPG